MIDTGEAVRWLDIYSDDLVSLSLLVRASTLQDKTDEEMCEIYEGLKSAIETKQKEAMMLAHDIVATKKRRSAGSDSLADVLGVNAAIQRCVLAANQANEALKPPQESFAEGMARIHAMVAAREREAKEAKEREAKEAKEAKEKIAKEAQDANAVSPTTVNDAAAVRVVGERP
jgi:hypothetical protein